MILAVVGLIGGMALALAGAGFLSGLLLGVSPHDPAPYVLVGGLLLAATLAATLLPARRASRTDLIEALRRE